MKGVKNIDRIDQLIDRLNQNLSDYHNHIKGFAKEQIIEMAGRINAMSDAHTYMTQHHAFDYEQAEYLLQFKNPLEIVADKWEARISDLSDMSFDLDKVFYDKDAEINGYELAEAGEPVVIPAENTARESAATDKPTLLGQTADVQKEAERIIAEFTAKTEPDSLDKTHFVVPLSREFTYLASSGDQERLLDALPYKTASMSTLKGEKGIFVFVAKDELQKEASDISRAPNAEQLKSLARKEAARLIKELRALKEPNDSFSGQYTAKISDEFIKQAGFSYDDLLFRAFAEPLLMAFGSMSGKEGSFLTVSNRVRKELRVAKEKPSILGELAEAKNEVAARTATREPGKKLDKEDR